MPKLPASKTIAKQAKPILKVFGSTTWLLTKIGIVFFVALIIGGVGMGTGMVVGALEDVPSFDPSSLERPNLPSYIYDINGDLITEIHDAQNRIPISYADIPENLENAFLAAEDRSFKDHLGFDLRGIGRALYTNLLGSGSQGGSTITQQIAKQAFLSSKKKFSRKIQELYLSIQIERRYKKEEIFEFYVNNVTFYNHSAYGVEAAAQTYFQKSIGELTLAECALLAGIPNSPMYYSPDPDNMEPAIYRRNNVLSMMLHYGYINEGEYQQAINEEIVLNMAEGKGWPYPHYTDAVVHTHAVNALMETGYYENKEEAELAIRREGLHIYTALDPEIQGIMEEVMFDDKYYPKNTFVFPEGHNRAGRRYPQAAGVLMDPKTGYVLGMVGGREFSRTNKLNRYNSMFQPGSAIKPIIDYGPAFELGILSPASILDDSPTAWPSVGKYYTPENVSRTFKGLVTVREALVHSYNLPAVKAYEKLMAEGGSKAGVDFARKLGLANYGERNKNNPSAYMQLSTAIGSQEVTPLEMAQAYSGFANKGVTSKPIFILKILNREGEEIYTVTETHEVAMSEQTAFLVTDVLKDVVSRGTMSGSGLAKYNVAGKTGTTNDNHDRWRIGYTPNYVLSIWLGNDDRQATIDGKIVAISGTKTGGEMTKMFGTIFSRVIGNNVVSFPSAPAGLTKVTVCAKSGLLPSDNCAGTVTDWFKTSAIPTETCDMHVLLRICTATGLRATDYCPEHLVEQRVFLNRPEVDPTDDRWLGKAGRLPADYDLRPPGFCSLHGPSSDLTLEGNVLQWEWSPPEPNEGEEPTEYIGFNLYYSRFGETEKLNSELIPLSTRFFYTPAQAPGMPYQYRLVLVSSANREYQKHKLISYTQPLGTSLTGQPKEADIVLTWNPPSLHDINYAVLGGYKLYKDGELLASIDDPGTTTFTDVGAAQPGSYKYRIMAVYIYNGTAFETPSGDPFPLTIAAGEPDPDEPDPEPDPEDPEDPENPEPGDHGFQRSVKILLA